MSLIREVSIHNRKITFEFNKYAKQAQGSVMVTSGGTQVLVTVCAASEPNPEQDFFPLGVDYIEKTYAAGRIPGGYTKREGRPTDAAALSARVIDRPLRPCFPEEFRNETVITATVLSYEHGFSPAPLALVGASCALMISEIPFNGPVAGLRLGLKNGSFIIDPMEGEATELDLTIACKPGSVLMVEAGAHFLSEETLLDAIDFAQKAMVPLFDLQHELRETIGKAKWPLVSWKPEANLLEKIQRASDSRFKTAFTEKDKATRGKLLKETTKALFEEFKTGHETEDEELKKIIDFAKGDYMRSMVLREKIRIDGRRTEDIRPISCEIGVLKRPHGSSLFTRGETQALASVTLSAPDDVQRTESLWNEDTRHRFMLHYNFPPFCVGEARMQRTPGRREIGHGALAHRALTPTIPDASKFGYSIRLVSETLESNGSSSMAAVCSGTMALLAAGVPIEKPIAGIAMGLIKSDTDYAILSDILGDEDHLGDMDFKVCGSKDGITALQMDIKIDGISRDLMALALAQAKRGRQFILGKIEDTIVEPQELAPNAPRMFKVKIKPEKIRDVIGAGGKNIKKITSDTGVKLDVEESGFISIIAPDAMSAQAAKAMIRSFTANPEVGDIYLGKAVKVTEFGVFVELRPGCEGLCHISQWEDRKVDTLDGLVKEGDEVLVKVIDVDRQGRVKISRRDAFGQKPTYN